MVVLSGLCMTNAVNGTREQNEKQLLVHDFSGNANQRCTEQKKREMKGQ